MFSWLNIILIQNRQTKPEKKKQQNFSHMFQLLKIDISQMTFSTVLLSYYSSGDNLQNNIGCPDSSQTISLKQIQEEQTSHPTRKKRHVYFYVCIFLEINCLRNWIPVNVKYLRFICWWKGNTKLLSMDKK